jgi:hypothetical protein
MALQLLLLLFYFLPLLLFKLLLVFLLPPLVSPLLVFLLPPLVFLLPLLQTLSLMIMAFRRFDPLQEVLRSIPQKALLQSHLLVLFPLPLLMKEGQLLQAQDLPPLAHSYPPQSSDPALSLSIQTRGR